MLLANLSNFSLDGIKHINNINTLVLLLAIFNGFSDNRVLVKDFAALRVLLVLLESSVLFLNFVFQQVFGLFQNPDFRVDNRPGL